MFTLMLFLVVMEAFGFEKMIKIPILTPDEKDGKEHFNDNFYRFN